MRVSEEARRLPDELSTVASSWCSEGHHEMARYLTRARDALLDAYAELDRYEKAEDEADVAEAEASLKRGRLEGTTLWKEVKAKLGLDRQQPMGTSRKKICLCGSTRFKAAWFEWNARLTLEEGAVVLSICHWTYGARVDPTAEQKELLDDIHKAKIDCSDEVFVLDVDGYFGDSTRSEIEHAEKTGKKIRYLNTEHPGWSENDCKYWGLAPAKPPLPEEVRELVEEAKKARDDLIDPELGPSPEAELYGSLADALERAEADNAAWGGSANDAAYAIEAEDSRKAFDILMKVLSRPHPGDGLREEIAALKARLAKAEAVIRFAKQLGLAPMLWSSIEAYESAYGPLREEEG